MLSQLSFWTWHAWKSHMLHAFAMHMHIHLADDFRMPCRTLWNSHAVQASAWLAAHPSHQAKSISLSAMAESTMGKPLNKAMQTSNWAARPLSPQQLLYAALDAHVCLQVCDAVSASCAAGEIELPDLTRLAQRWP